jgi:2-keto-4-pentenoate hydratase/2-oxohepta-3-ene-1,7-dioic acid hydratase in catechol pathway
MKLARFAHDGTAGWGLVDTAAGTVQPIRAPFATWAGAVTDGAGRDVLSISDERLPLASLKLLPPLEPGSQAFAVGANYQRHLEELNMQPPAAPIAFIKSTRALIGAADDIIHATVTKQLDYEVELVAVLGKPIAAGGDPTLSVLGYTVGNDVSARDLQRSGIGFDLFSAKSLDHTSGLGPWLVTRDEFGPGTPDLRLWLSVNGEMRQDSRTGLMRWKLDELLLYVNQRAALQPGDVLFTGTPEGVAWASGRFIKPGEVVVAGIDGIGAISNRVVAPAN